MRDRELLVTAGGRVVPEFLKPILLRLWYRSRNRSLRLGPGVRLNGHCSFGKGVRFGVGGWAANSTVGDHSYLARRAGLFFAHVGKYCSIGDEALVGLARHPARGYISTYPAFFSASNDAATVSYRVRSEFDETPVTIVGSDVWIGARAMIQGGITVGHGAVVGAGAIVTRDVPDYGVMVGVPARLMRFRFTAEEIRVLLEARWWDWGSDELHRVAPLFGDPEAFFAMLVRRGVG